LNARQDIQRKIQFVTKETNEFKTSGGVWIRLHLIVDTLALLAEVNHAFNIGKQTTIDQPSVSIQEEILLIAQ
jgi:hypothetical protein